MTYIPNYYQSRFRTPVLNRVQTKAGRCYELPDGRLVPGVTTALEVIAKPALLFWASKEERKLCLDSAVEAFTELTGSESFQNTDPSEIQNLAPAFRTQLESKVGRSYAHIRKSRTAANIGTEAHGAIERWIKEKLGQSVGPFPALSDGAHIAYMAFEDWAKSVNFEPLAAEVMVFDPYGTGYAGTLDWLARINGILSVGDWKTGKSIYAEAFLQNAAYLSALRKQCRLGTEPMQGVIVRLPKELDDVTEHPFEVKIIPAEDHRPNYLAFLKTVDLWRWLHPEVPQSVPKPPHQPVAVKPKPWATPANRQPLGLRPSFQMRRPS